MLAKTIASVSLVVVLDGWSGRALADPDPPPLESEVAPPAPGEPAGRFLLGAGYSTDDCFSLRASISTSRLFHTDNQLSLDSLVSARRQLFLMRFAHPDLFGSQIGVGFDLFNDRRVLPGFARQAAGGAVTLYRPVADHVQASLSYRVEGVKVDPDATTLARGPFVAAPGELVIASLRASLAYSTLDSPLLPSRGTRAGAAVEVADPRLGSEAKLTRYRAWVDTHQPLGPLTLHLDAAFDAIGSPERQGVPISERLFFDGSSVIRGYAPGAIGPRDGGYFQLSGHAALEAPVVRRLGLSAETFFDAGAIVDRAGHGGLGHSAGFGVIWRSPLGPLHVDVAFPLEHGPPCWTVALGL